MGPRFRQEEEVLLLMEGRFSSAAGAAGPSPSEEGVVPSCTIQCQLAQEALPCAFLVASPSSTYSRAEGAVRRSHSLPLSYIPCPTSNLTPTTTFITAVSLDQVEEGHLQAAITITTIRAADYFLSDRVGELCCLLFIFRFEPHVLQVCCPSEYLIVYERTQPIFLDAAPNPSLSSQFPQQDPTQTHTDPSIAHFGQQGWQTNQGNSSSPFSVSPSRH